MKKILSVALLGLVFVGCTKEQSESRFPEIQFGSSIDASTQGSKVSRAAVVNASPLTGVVFLRKDHATTAPTVFTGSTSLTADRATNGNITFTAPVPTYALNNDFAFFAAYHPAGALASEVATWTIDGKTDILLTPVYDAGKYTAPVIGTMTFKHQLAQLAVVCKADPAVDVLEASVQSAWGDITKIELLDTPTERVYTYATNAVTNGGTVGPLPLLNNDYETTFASVAITKNAGNTVTAAGMFAPAALGTTPLKLKVYTAVETAGKEVSVQLKDALIDKGFEMGQSHTVTLIFKAGVKDIEVLATTIEDWDTGYSGSGELTK